MNDAAQDLKEIYQRLRAFFGPQHWWPARSRFEVIIGAILTQNTSWANVEKAIFRLRRKNLLSPRALKAVSVSLLARQIRPAGYFNVKARRLKNFVEFFTDEYQGSIRRMSGEKLPCLRKKLLSVNGIGLETADSILLYALDKPIFVVDAYTRRIFSRQHLIRPDADYHALQDLFMSHLKRKTAMFNEYHALIVALGKNICRTKPLCHECPLKNLRCRVN